MISLSNLDRSLCKEILKIIRLWRDRQVYPDVFMSGIITGLEKSLQDKKKDRGLELPDAQVEFEDLYNFALNKKNLEMWVEKVNELKAQLDIILKHSKVWSDAQRPKNLRSSRPESKNYTKRWSRFRSTGSLCLRPKGRS